MAAGGTAVVGIGLGALGEKVKLGVMDGGVNVSVGVSTGAAVSVGVAVSAIVAVIDVDVSEGVSNGSGVNVSVGVACVSPEDVCIGSLRGRCSTPHDPCMETPMRLPDALA